MDRIGTGEGAQAYGHGLYFAENEGVAKGYRDRLGADPFKTSSNPAELAFSDIQYHNGNAEAALSIWRDLVARKPNSVGGKAAAEKLAAYERGEVDALSPGKMYEVKINAEPEQFLDWDKPLSQQPKAVIDLFDKVYADLSPEDRAKVQNSPGQHIYEGVGAKLGKPHRGDGTVGGLIAGLNRHDVATQTFRDAGIPGIKYLDQGSRGDGQGTYNYVVFDDKLIEITAKDGVPMSAKDKNDVMFAIRDGGRQDPLGYTSRALDAARSLKQAKGTPEQMLAQLKAAGVRQAEMDATGLSDAFDGQKTITRDAIVQHLEENRVGLNEVVYGDPNAAAIASLREELNLQRRSPRDKQDPQRIAELESMIDDLIDPDAKDAKWAEHSLDKDNPTYRETVLHLPGKEFAETPEMKAAVSRRMELDEIARERRWTEAERDEARRLPSIIRDIEEGRHRDNVNFKSGHFPEPNIVGHLMTSTVKDAQGRPVYLIDQIQSDWGQKLRDGGVRDEAKIADIRQQIETEREAIRAGIEPLAGKASDKTVTRLRELAVSGDDQIRANFINKAGEELEKSIGISDAVDLIKPLKSAQNNLRRLAAELNTAQASVSGHPLVNTTDQWTNTTLRRAIRQAAEQDAHAIAIPSGDTVLTYNPGDENGMRQFYGSSGAIRKAELEEALASGRKLSPAYIADLEKNSTPVVGIVPKNLRNLLQKIDKASPAPERVDTLDTPTKGKQGKGFTVFPLSDAVKRSVLDEGQPMFALRGLDPSPEARKARAEEMGFDTSKVWYHGTTKDFQAFSLEMFGKNTATEGDVPAVFLSTSPKVAEGYANGWGAEPRAGANILPVFINRSNMDVWEVGGGRLTPDLTRDALTEAKKDGKDGVIFLNALDSARAIAAGGAASRNAPHVVAVFDPANIRSVNAMFDPDKAGSANLMFALRDRLGFARNSPELRSMNALVRDLAFDLGITVRRGFKTTQSKIAKSAAKQVGDTLNAFYDPMTGVLRLQKFNDVSGVAEVAGNILKQRHGKAFQTAADRVNQAMKDELYHLNFERTQFPIRENNLVAMREELATIEAQGWMKDSMETQQRGATLRRDIPLREADLEAARAKIAALEVLTKEAPRVPEDMGAWFQTYLMNPQAASIDPFTDVFEAALDIVDPALLGKIEGAQQSVSAYAKANAAEVMTSMIVPSEIPGAWDRLTHDAERFGWKMALGMRLSDLYGAVYANDHPFYLMSLHLLRLHAKNTGNKIDLKAIDHPAKLWRISAQARAWANRDLDKGIRPADSVDHAGPSMMDVLTTALGANRRKAVDTGPGSRYRDFGAYLMARMGVERWTRYEAAKAAGELGQLREPYAVPKSVMITAVQDLEVKYPSFAAAAQMLYAFQRNLLTLQRDKGLISEETYQALQAEKNYVPSLRSFEDEKTGGSGQTAKKGEAAIQDVIKRFRGSQRDVIDPISSIALKVFKTRADIAVNDTIQKLLYLAEQAGPGGGLFAERLDARQAQAVQVDLRQALKNAAKEANLSENDRAALVDLASEMLGSNVTTTMFTQGLLRGGKGEPVVYMREAGKIVPIRLGKMGEGGHASARLGKQVWDLLNTYGETHTNFVLQMMALPAQIIRTMVVSHPSFMLANIIRDAPAAWGYDPQALPIWTQLVGSFDVIRGAEYVERYRSTAGMMGGEATQLFDQFLADHDVETLVRKGYRFASFNSFSNGISFLSDAFSLRNWPDKAFGATMGGIAGFSMAGPVGGVAGAVLGGSIGGKAMAAAGELTETATRSRLWKHAFGRAKAAGLGDVEAAAEAAYWAHAYGDYSRHGLKTDVVRKWVPFLNANLQANDAFFQRLLAKGDYGFEATKYVPGQVALWPLYKAGVLQLPATLTAKQREELAMSAWAWFSTMAVIGSASMVYALMYRDDDRIKMLPENLRANHWNIPLDDLAHAIGAELPKEHRGKHFARIPKPFERAIFANTIERLTMEYARGNPRWLEHWLSDIYEVTKPPLMPTALDLPAQLLMNRDSFSGREIVPRQGAGQRMRSEMFDEYTSQFARWLGGQLDLAPQQVDFMIAKLGSTWGRDATRANIPGAPWFDPKAPTQGLDEKFIASRFLYKIGKGTEAEKAFREVMGGEDPLPRIWEKIAVPYNRLDAQAESYKFLKDRLRQDAKAMGRLDSMTASERGYALLEGHWQGSNAKYQQLHPMKRAETVSQLVSQMQKELIGDHSTAGKKGPRQTILDLSPDEKQAARDALTQYKAMEVYNALVLTGEKGWQNRGYLPAKGVLDELATGVPEIAAEFQRRLEKAHVLPFEGVKTTWPRVKEKLESQELLRRVKDKDTIGLGALLAAEYGEARFP